MKKNLYAKIFEPGSNKKNPLKYNNSFTSTEYFSLFLKKSECVHSATDILVTTFKPIKILVTYAYIHFPNLIKNCNLMYQVLVFCAFIYNVPKYLLCC